MSKIKDWLTVVKAGVKNGDKIVEAIWVSTQIKNEGQVSVEAVAEIMKRKEICASCPYNSKNAPEHGLTALDVPFQHCIFCACRIGGDDTKEYCLSCNCGIKEYNKRNPETPMELKWSAFEEPVKEPAADKT
jgi:predicted nucleic acid-binding Zn ribbon protein